MILDQNTQLTLRKMHLCNYLKGLTSVKGKHCTLLADVLPTSNLSSCALPLTVIIDYMLHNVQCFTEAMIQHWLARKQLPPLK